MPCRQPQHTAAAVPSPARVQGHHVEHGRLVTRRGSAEPTVTIRQGNMLTVQHFSQE